MAIHSAATAGFLSNGESGDAFKSFLVEELRAFHCRVCEAHEKELRSSQFGHSLEQDDSEATTKRQQDEVMEHPQGIDSCEHVASKLVRDKSFGVEQLGPNVAPSDTIPVQHMLRDYLKSGVIRLGEFSSDDICRQTSTSNLVLNRWAKICELVLIPKTLAKQEQFFHMHEFWSSYFRMLVRNDGRSQAAFEDARQKIVASREKLRRGSVRISNLGCDSMSHLNSNTVESSACIVIHSDSKFWRFWMAMLFLVVCYDTFVLPIKAAFEMEDSYTFKATMWFASCFWAGDLLINLASGRYSANTVCFKSRMVFDVLIVLIDWALLVAFEVIEDLSHGNTLRALRIIRLIRLFWLAKLRWLLSDVLSVDSKIAIAFSSVIKALLAYCIYVHLLACVWYAASRANDTGWGSACAINSTPVDCYIKALHWALTQAHGTTKLELNTLIEGIFASAAVFVGLLQLAFLVSWIHATVQAMGDDKFELQQRCANLANRHKLSPLVTQRMMRIINASGINLHLDRVVEEERSLLAILPVSLMAQVLEEMRTPLLSISILRDIKCVSSKMMTRLCTKAVTLHTIAASEVVFSVGDEGSHWRIVDSGVLHYYSQMDDIWQSLLKRLSSAAVKMAAANLDRSPTMGHTETECGSGQGSLVKVLTRSSLVSEMVLWTPWVHTGDMVAANDCAVLQLNAESLHRIVKARVDTCMLVARYAQNYVKQLTQSREPINDLFQCDNFLDEENYISEYSLADSTQHLAFLSHFKEEAGTEATLLQEAMASLALERDSDVTSVFLDSENLTDLSGLQDHVVNSRNLVLLLTPGVLHRPWCLVEIVTAHINNVQIVPVEIQRPGLKFVYPEEEFYSRLREGAVLSRRDTTLLSVEGISLEDVIDALRNVFTQIALPYSPHKSKNVREAELADIMNRCDSISFSRHNSLRRVSNQSSGLLSQPCLE